MDPRVEASLAAAARSARDKESVEAENQKLKDRMQELIAKFRENAETLRSVETERTTFKQSLTTRETELSSCVAHNEALFKLNEEVLSRVAGQGAFSRLASLEPFTKLKRVELENLMDDYKYRAEEQHVQVPAASTPLERLLENALLAFSNGPVSPISHVNVIAGRQLAAPVPKMIQVTEVICAGSETSGLGTARPGFEHVRVASERCLLLVRRFRAR